MSPDSTASLAQLCRQYRLLESDQSDELERQLLPIFRDWRELARDLVRRGWLTPWQVNQIVQGRTAQLLLGSHVLLDRLGEGGMGAVFKARNWKLGRIVALKVIRKERLDNDMAIRRFRREIEAAAQLSHAHIVHAYDADEVDGTHLFVMEYAEGRDLACVVKARGPLPIAEACAYVRQAALGLQHAFERGLVHRDIKPSNLLLTHPGAVVKLLDMGLARLEPGAGERSSTLTQEGAVMGTPDYIAPEQARDSHTADIRSDLYSLGCTLYFLLTARVPFPGGSLTRKLLRHQVEAPPSVRSHRPEVPEALARLIDRLLAKQPEQRFQTPAELVAALDAFLRGDHAAPPNRAGADATLPDGVVNPFAELRGGETIKADTTAPEGRSRRRGFRWPYLAATAGFLLAAFVLFLLLPDRKLSTTERDNSEAENAAANHKASSPSALDQEQRRADEALKALAAKAADAQMTFAEFARDVRVFESKYGGTPAALRAAQLLTQRPSPLDTLDPAKMPEDVKAHWRRSGFDGRDVVAVLGEHGRRHWSRYVNCIAFSPDGKLLASGGEESVRLWDAATLRERAVLPLRGIRIAFAPDGRTLASAGLNVVLWDVAGTPPKKITELPAAGLSVAISPDGKLLACGTQDKLVKLWDLTGAKPVERAVLRGHTDGVWAVAFSPDSRLLASGSTDATARIWDVLGPQPKERAVLRGHKIHLNAVAFSPDGSTLATGSQDGTARLWDLTTEKPKEKAQLVHNPLAGAFIPLAFAPNGREMATGGLDHFLQLWDLTAQPPKSRALLSGHKGVVFSVAYSPDGRTVATGGSDGTVRLWDVAAGKELLPPTGPIGPLNSVFFSADDTALLAAGSDNTVRAWDTEKGETRRTFPGARAWFGPGRASSGGRRALSLGNDGVARLFGRKGDLLRELGKANVAAVSNDGSRALLARDGGGLSLLDLEEVSEIQFWSSGGKEVKAAAFLPRGQRAVVAGSDGVIRNWQVATGRLRKEIRGEWKEVYLLAASPDGRTVLVAVGNLHYARLLDLETGRDLHHWEAGATVTALALSPDGKRAATAILGNNGSGIVHVYDTEKGERLHEWKLPGPVHDLAFAHDGRHLATANVNGAAYIFRLAAPTR